MNEENTQHMPDGRSFEDRVFARFDALEASFNSRLDGLDARLTAFEERVQARLDKMDARMGGLDARLTSLEEKVDQRLKETRPIWEQVLVRLDSLEKGSRGIAKDVDYLKRKFRIFNEDILTWQNQQEDMEERVSKLESETAK